MTANDDFWDDAFHACALAAYLETWRRTGQFPPDSEATRRLAYDLYEQALAEKNRRRVPPTVRPPRREAGQRCAAPEGGDQPRTIKPVATIR